MLQRYVIGSVGSMPPGTRRRVEVGGRDIAVFNVRGRFFALRDVCPHQGAPLSAGVIVGTVVAHEPGCYEFDPERSLVKCPRHGWEYELETGRSWYDPEHDRVRAYGVSVEPGGGLADRRPGPLLAETFAISVEEDYVVIEL